MIRSGNGQRRGLMDNLTESEAEDAVLGYAMLHGPDIGPEGPAGQLRRGAADRTAPRSA